jgi:WD40 repeat protein
MSSLEQSFHSREIFPKTLVFSPDGTKIASDGIAWNITTGQQIRTPDLEQSTAVGFLSNDELVLESKSGVDLLNLATGKIVPSNIQLPDCDDYLLLSVQPESRLVLVELRKRHNWHPLGRLQVYNVDTGKAILNVKSDFHSHLPNGRFISKNGRRIALVGHWDGYQYGRIGAWSLEHDQPKIFSRDYGRPLKACGFSPDGTQVAIAIGLMKYRYSDEKTELLVVDIHADNITHTLHDAGDVTCVAFAPWAK